MNNTDSLSICRLTLRLFGAPVPQLHRLEPEFLWEPAVLHKCCWVLTWLDVFLWAPASELPLNLKSINTSLVSSYNKTIWFKATDWHLMKNWNEKCFIYFHAESYMRKLTQCSVWKVFRLQVCFYKLDKQDILRLHCRLSLSCKLNDVSVIGWNSSALTLILTFLI